jgi:hypothetical protein
MSQIGGDYREVIEKSSWVAIATTGPNADKAKAQFLWARGALVAKVSGLKIYLP